MSGSPIEIIVQMMEKNLRIICVMILSRLTDGVTSEQLPKIQNRE